MAFVKHIPVFYDDEFYQDLGCSSDLEEDEQDSLLEASDDQHEPVTFRKFENWDDDDDDEDMSNRKAKEIVWRKEKFAEKKIYVTSSPDHDEAPTTSRKLIDYFHAYLPPSLWMKAVDHTNKYIEKNMENVSATSYEEMMIYVALNIASTIFVYGTLSLSWSEFGQAIFKNNMTKTRFFEIRTAIRFVDTEEKSDDRLYKVRPIYDALRKRCNSLKRDNDICIDEHMVPFRGWVNVERFILEDTKPWGIKIFVMANKNGQILDFLLYQGNTTEYSKEDVEKYGIPGAIVLHLVRSLEPERYNLCCDNHFWTYELVEELTKRKINCMGIIRPELFGNPPLKKDKALIRKGRGSIDQVTNQDNTIGIIKWVDPDKDACTVVSNFVLNGTSDAVSRFDKKAGKRVLFEKPEIVRLLETNMRGAYTFYQLLEDHRNLYRAKKWTVKLINYAVDFAVISAYLEYKNDHPSGMGFLDFRMALYKEILEEAGKCSKKVEKTKRSSARLQEKKCVEDEEKKEETNA